MKLDGKITFSVCKVVSETIEIDAEWDWVDNEPSCKFPSIDLHLKIADAEGKLFLLVSNHSSVSINGFSESPLPVVIDNACQIKDV